MAFEIFAVIIIIRLIANATSGRILNLVRFWLGVRVVEDATIMFCLSKSGALRDLFKTDGKIHARDKSKFKSTERFHAAVTQMTWQED
jgi:hypothetical protein